MILAGVDAGGTKIRAAIADTAGRLIAHLEGPGANAAVDGPEATAAAIAAVIRPALRGPRLDGVVAGVAGAWSPAVSRAVSAGLRRELGVRSAVTMNDAVAVLLAGEPGRAAMLLSIGTGTVLIGMAPGRSPVRVDGWGPLAGDLGSGWWIGRSAVERALAAHDGRAPHSPFAAAVLRALRLRNPGADIHRLYALERPQPVIAALVPLVLRHARRGDRAARSILREAAAHLADTVRAGLRHMPGGRITLRVSGSLARVAPGLLSDIRALPRIRVELTTIRPEAACLRLAGMPIAPTSFWARLAVSRPRRVGPALEAGLPESERANPRTGTFSRLAPAEMAGMMNREDRLVAPAIGRILPAVGRAIALAESALRRGGRIVYVGAGTSGRLGVLDASEAPPTFGVRPGVVLGIMAGGRAALDRGIEGAEDDPRAGAAAVRRARVSRHDLVIGLSVSGGARFVLAAIAEARRRGAATAGITVVPGSPLARAVRVPLVVRVGPETIAGSSRLKAGTAQKMLLNMISTAAFARIGRIHGNLMTHVTPVNAKLKRRATRIAAEVLGIPEPEAAGRLVRANWNLPRVLGR